MSFDNAKKAISLIADYLNLETPDFKQGESIVLDGEIALPSIFITMNQAINSPSTPP